MPQRKEGNHIWHETEKKGQEDRCSKFQNLKKFHLLAHGQRSGDCGSQIMEAHVAGFVHV